jgi:hypothetical protein
MLIVILIEHPELDCLLGYHFLVMRHCVEGHVVRDDVGVVYC